MINVYDMYCKQDLIEMDREDEISGRMEYIHEELLSGYYNFFPAKETDKPDTCSVGNGGPTLIEPNQFSSDFSQLEIKPIRRESL
jgi:hypothetical protein